MGRQHAATLNLSQEAKGILRCVQICTFAAPIIPGLVVLETAHFLVTTTASSPRRTPIPALRPRIHRRLLAPLRAVIWLFNLEPTVTPFVSKEPPVVPMELGVAVLGVPCTKLHVATPFLRTQMVTFVNLRSQLNPKVAASL